MYCLFVHQAAELYGSDRVLLAMVCELQQRGRVKPIVIVPEAGPLVAEMQAQGIEIHVCDLIKISRASYSPRGILRLFMGIRKSLLSIDVVVNRRPIAVVHTNTLAVLSGAFWSAARRVPHVWHVHEIIAKPKLVAWGFALLLQLFAHRVVCISRMVQENLLARLPCLRQKTDIVFNGIALPGLPDTVQASRHRAALGLGDHELVITLVGRINAWKGHRLMLEAARLLTDEGVLDQGVKLLIVGGPPPGQEYFLTQLEQDIQMLGLQERVVIRQFVKDIWPIWASTDIAVVPSTDPEPFGMVAIEAMAMEKPLVAAGHGGLLDIVAHEESGFLFKPNDAVDLAKYLKKLIEAPGLRHQQGRYGRERVRSHFSMAAQAEAFERIYNHVAHIHR